MKKDNLITKWLDNNLDANELQAFKQLDAFSDLMKIDEAAKHFKAPSFDEDKHLKELLSKKPTTTSTPYFRYIASIAAILAMFLCVYFFVFTSEKSEVLAVNTEQTEFSLPDTSQVILNAGSSITYIKKNWESNRNLYLEGEAYFKVAKGATFTVQTSLGEVKVLGTQFTVKERNNFFEVSCYEGLVLVFHGGKTIELPAGNSYKSYEDFQAKESIQITEPSWIGQKSLFKSVPFIQVVQELERQHDVVVEMDDALHPVLYSGSFTHENLETALEAITIPLNLSFDIKGKIVVLKSK